MCVILTCEDEFPTLDLLESCELTNPHGGGIAWLNSKKEIQWKKGIDSKEIYKMIKSNMVQLPCIIHFRIASVGSITKELCHPFPISDKSELDLEGTLSDSSDGVLFHNGTISNHETLLKDSVMLSNRKMLKGEVSDSRVMAFSIAKYGHEFISMLDEDFEYNKYAILDSNGITKYGKWHDEGKIKASNDYYKVDRFYSNGFCEDYDEYDSYGINQSYTKEDAIKELEQEQKINEGMTSLMGSCDTSTKLSKRQRKKKRKYLIRQGWKQPEKLDDTALIEWCEYHKQNEKNVKQAKYFEQTEKFSRESKVNAKIDEIKNKIKEQKSLMEYNNYEDDYYNQQNEEWVNQCNSLAPFTT